MNLLYHTMYKPPTGDALMTTCARTENGRSGTFLYAATHLSKSLAFAFSYHPENPEALMNTAIQDADEEIILVCGGQKTLDAPRHIKVFGLPDTNFVEVPGARQCISEQPVPFKDTTTILETTNIDDLMARGLQIFVMEETVEELLRQDFPGQYESLSVEDTIEHLLKQKRVRWINAEKSIGVSKTLADKFDPPAQVNADPRFQLNL